MSYDVNEAFLADKSYKLGDANKGQTITDPNGNRWMVVDTRDTATGYQGALLKNLDTGKYELVSRGTEFDREPIKDGVADLQMGLGRLPDQIADARAFLQASLDKIIDDGGTPSSDLSLTGHSLGGSITQVLGAENPLLRATAFNPYGTGNLIPEGNHPNITNHIASSDTVSTLPGSNMVGETLRYESPGGHGIAQFVNTSLATQSGVHVTINMPPVQGVDSDPMGTGDGAAIMNAVRVETPLNTNSDHTTDYNFADTAGAGRGMVNPDAVTPPATVFNPATALPSYSGDNAVTVQPGDTVSSIAKRYDMTVQQFSSYLKEQYGDSADLNSIVAGHKLPIPQDVYERTLGGVNGLDLPPETPHLTPDAKEVNDALIDAFNQADKTATDIKAQNPGTQVAGSGGTVPNTSAPSNTNTFTHYLDTQGDALTTAQQDALAAQLDQLNLGSDKSLSFYTLPSGGALIANAEGHIVGEITQNSAKGDLHLKATTIDASGNTVEVNNHINEQGSVLTQEQYNTQAQQQASALFNSLMAANNWDHLSDVGKLSALANLYNATDKLGEAFGATGNNLPGDLGAASGWLSLAQGLQSGDSLIIANGINVVSDRALDNAMNEAFGNTAAGESVPYLSYALAIRNFEDNPEVAAGTMAGTYIGQALGAEFGPIGIALGGAIGGFVGGAFGGLFGDDDIPMRQGLACAQWDAQGRTQIITTQDAEGGGSTANSWMGSLVDGLQTQLQSYNSQHNASDGLGLALIPNLLPSVGFKYDPDGYNLANGARGFMYLQWTDDQGQTQTRFYDGAGNRGDDSGETLSSDFVQHAQSAIAPAWQVQTVLAHYQQGQAIELPTQANSLPQALGDGLHQTLQVVSLQAANDDFMRSAA